MTTAGATPALRVEGLEKRFGGVRALAGVDLEIGAGEVRGLVGENGSGKSSLVKSLSGYHVPDAGRVWLWGREVSFPVRGPRDYGLDVVHQDLGLVPGLSVVENFGVGVGWGSSRGRGIRWGAQRRELRRLGSRFGLEVDPDRPVEELSPAERAMLAIVRAVRQLEDAHGRALLILDEPTAYLTSAEVDRVIELMRSVRASGASVIFISHRLGEVLEVCDRVTVLRDGRLVDTVDARDTSSAELIRLMLGRELGDFYPAKADRGEGEAALRAVDVSGPAVDGVTLTARAGEILGLTGLAGMGHDELIQILGGARRPTGGTLEVSGRELDAPGTRDMLEAGVALVPANRQRDGVWLSATAVENISLPILPSYYRGGRLRKAAESADAARLMERFGVRPPLPERAVGSFSGGNQQKIVLAKWLQRPPRVLLLHEPTQGVDAGAKKDILEIVKRVAADGAAVVIASAEYEQLASACHRVLILRDGRVAAELDGAAVTEDRILQVCHAGRSHRADSTSTSTEAGRPGSAAEEGLLWQGKSA
jgi:ribose transport system ATP-binding protein